MFHPAQRHRPHRRSPQAAPQYPSVRQTGIRRLLPGPQKPAVSVWNATEGVEFNKNSKDYNKENDTYTLYGSAAQDFYLNGALVQVRDGKYEVPVKTTTQDLVFSTDQAGKNVLKSFTTFTPKAFFNWQNVDKKRHNRSNLFKIC